MQKNLAPKWAHYLKYLWPPLNPGEAEVAVYDLEHQPTTFDFVAWIVLAQSLGAKHVRFAYEGKIQDWKYSASIAWKRFANIVIPVCELSGLEWSVGPRVSGFTVGHHYGHVNGFHRKYGIKKLPLTDEKRGHITVTIRDSIRFKSRDSNRKEWDKLINHLEKTEKVIVIEDGETSGLLMSVEQRMKLYSGAKMNLSVSNGPMALCHFSDAPYLTFKMVPEGGKELEDHMTSGGFPPGSQFEFKTDQQELVWETDTFENMIKAYERITDDRLRKAA